MAGFSDTFEQSILKLIFNATAIANVADNAASSPLTNLYVALHTADPGDSGNQSTSETTYTSYARTAVARTTGGFTISGTAPTQAVPVANIVFPTCTGGTAAITHASVGVAISGATSIIISGPLTPNIAVATGVPPTITTGSAITLD